MKLAYFGITGRAEPIRWALKLGKIEFEDEHINSKCENQEEKEDPSYKKTSPNKRVPYLVLDNGDTYAESVAILLYVAEKANLMPQSESKELIFNALQIIFHMEDLSKTVYNAVFFCSETSEKEKEDFIAKHKESVHRSFKIVDSWVAQTAGEKWALGQKETFLDLYLANFIMGVQREGAMGVHPFKIADDLFEKDYPQLSKVLTSVTDLLKDNNITVTGSK